MRILMTGSTGFVGKCLVKMLEASGHELWHLVRNKKGFEKEVVWDFTNPVPEEFPPCDIIVHLAALVNFEKIIDFLQYKVNTISTMKLAAYANTYNAYFIFASTVGIHESKCTTIDEKTPIRPSNHYEMSKYLSEEVIKSSRSDNYSILRICGIYGVDGPEHLGLNKAISNAFYKKIAPTLRGKGTAERNYICVYDVARWIIYLINKYNNITHSEGMGMSETLYLSGSEIMTIENYLGLIVEILLPGMELEKIDAPESPSLVVKSSPAPFPQLTFKQYLLSLSCSS